MGIGKLQGIKQAESVHLRKASASHQRELQIIEKLLNSYLVGFNTIGSFTLSDDNNLQYVRLKLVTHSFNSIYCAYTLLQQGYYHQVLLIARAVLEDWLLAKDCATYMPTLEALLDDEEVMWTGQLSFQSMAKRQKEEEMWKQHYGTLSKFAHPRVLTLRTLIDRNTNTLRLGPIYDEQLFIFGCEVLIKYCIMIMVEYMPSLLDSAIHDWVQESTAVIDNATSWLKEIQAKYGDKDHSV